MPNFHFQFLGGGAACGGGPGTNLLAFPDPVALTPAQLINAQLRLGVYPGGGWDIEEITWRVYAFCIGCIMVAGGGGPGVPAGPPAGGIAPAPAVPGAAGAANLPASPVATAVDATEKGQIGYHMGTAVGGSLGEYLAHTGPAGTLWFAFHLTRAMHNGATFTFAGGGAPDIVAFAVDPVTQIFYEWVVWENKGHCGNFGGLAAIGPALAQAQLILDMTALPGGIGGGPWPPDACIASQVDTFHGNFRAQAIDPAKPPRTPTFLPESDMDAFLRAYYRPFVDLLSKGTEPRNYDGRSFTTVQLPKDIRLGLDTGILNGFRGTPGSLSAAVASVASRGYANTSPETTYVHRTGISVELPAGWSSHGGDNVGSRSPSDWLQTLDRIGGG
jgi:hypothetical protein